MANAFPVTPEGPLEQRRGRVDNARDSQAQYYHLHGHIEVTGTGESQAKLVFPVHYVEKPLITFGGELAEGSLTPTPGAFPTWSAAVHAWNYRYRPDGTALYVGAVVGIVTTGPLALATTQVIVIHWSLQGVALRSPVGDDS